MIRTLPIILVAATLTVLSASSSASGTTSSAPLELLGGTTTTGYPIGGSGPSGIQVRFIDRGSFWVAVLIRNHSTRPVTLLRAQTPEPRNSLVRQVSAGFSRYTPCVGNRLCPWPSSPSSTRPLTLPPHTEAAVKLSYQLVSCAQAPTATLASSRTLILSYQTGHGAIKQETAALTGARLHLQQPAGVECLARPFSHIGLVGSFTTSPGHTPMPGSDGDMCSTTATGALLFRSRAFFDRSGVAFRIEITLPHYHGLGTYLHRQAEVTAVGGFGLHGWTTFHDPGTVAVTTAKATTIGGRFSAVFAGHRRFFRAYGAWRCTTLR